MKASGLAVAAGMVLAGCSAFDRYQWRPDPALEVCTGEWRWKQVEAGREVGLCTDETGPAPRGTTCTAGCLTISTYSRAEARVRIVQDGITLEAHERRHTRGENHGR